MTLTTNEIQSNEKVRFGVTGNALKYCAAALMVLNHLSQFLTEYVPEWFYNCGLPVASVFLFLSVEGFHYTHSRLRYLLQLYIGYVFMLVTGPLLGEWLPVEYSPGPTNNIFGSLFLVALFSLFFEWIRIGVQEKKPGKAILGGVFAAALMAYGWIVVQAQNEDWYTSPMAVLPSAFTCESGYLHLFGYTFGIVLLGLSLYFIRTYCDRENIRRLLQAAAVLAVNAAVVLDAQNGPIRDNLIDQLPMLAVIAAVFFYNGKRGKGVSPKFDKWFFYIFYPTHIYLLYFIAWMIQK